MPGDPTTDAGSMREVIRIEVRATVQDENGEEAPSWNLVAERRAQKLATPGSEVWSSKERSARIPTIFKMRFPKTFEVLPQMRVVHRDHVYNIISAIDSDGRSVNLLLTCEELVNEPAR